VPSTRTFGKILRGLRNKDKLTLRKLAHQAGCSFAYLSQLEADVARPSEELVRQLAKLFRVTSKDEEEMLFLARGVREQIAEIKEKYPHVAPAYFQKAFGGRRLVSDFPGSHPTDQTLLDEGLKHERAAGIQLSRSAWSACAR